MLITAFGELGVTITSTYIGQHGSDTLAAHLVVTRERRAPEQAELRATLSRSPRERCLLDHVHQLQEAHVARTGGTVAIDIAQGALTRATPV